MALQKYSKEECEKSWIVQENQRLLGRSLRRTWALSPLCAAWQQQLLQPRKVTSGRCWVLQSPGRASLCHTAGAALVGIPEYTDLA